MWFLIIGSILAVLLTVYLCWKADRPEQPKNMVVDLPGIMVFELPRTGNYSVWIFDWHFIIQRKVRWWARRR